MNEHNEQIRNRITPPPAEYTMRCSLCDFMAINSIQLKKHMMARHENTEKIRQNTECRFWLRGYCIRGNECKFKHTPVPLCKYELECTYWPNCKFSHPSVKPCKYQEYCHKNECRFAHFLGVTPPSNLYRNFPHLNREDGLWRPW